MDTKALTDLYVRMVRHLADSQDYASMAVERAINGQWREASHYASMAARASDIWERLPEECRTVESLIEEYESGMKAMSRALAGSTYAAQALRQASKGLWDEAQQPARRAASCHSTWGTLRDAVAAGAVFPVVD